MTYFMMQRPVFCLSYGVMYRQVLWIVWNWS